MTTNLRKGEEVDEEDDGERLEVSRRQPDGVTHDAHATVELQHLDELQRRHEDDERHDEAEQLVPDRQRHEVHVLA